MVGIPHQMRYLYMPPHMMIIRSKIIILVLLIKLDSFWRMEGIKMGSFLLIKNMRLVRLDITCMSWSNLLEISVIKKLLRKFVMVLAFKTRLLFSQWPFLSHLVLIKKSLYIKTQVMVMMSLEAQWVSGYPLKILL